jgi:Sigma-70 region 2
MMEPGSVLGSHRDVNEATKPAEVSDSAESAGGRFADFYRREYDRSVRLAWLLTGSRAAAEDVVQDAMTGVYRSLTGSRRQRRTCGEPWSTAPSRGSETSSANRTD